MRLLFAVALAVLAACTSVRARPVPFSALEIESVQRAAVEATVADSFFAAVTRLDEDALRRSVTATFELDSDSARLSLEEYVARVRRIAARGVRIQYAIRDVHSHGRGDVAWTSYRSRGTFNGDGNSTRWIEWMETAVLVRDASGKWRIDRLQSATVAKSP
jgi:ketosteroid isomerase-like protein